MIAAQEGNEIVDTMIEAELCVKHECYGQALERLEEVVQKYPRYLPAKEALAEVFRKTGNIERANEIVREAGLVSQQMAHEHCHDDAGQASAAELTRRLTERADTIIRQVYECGNLEEILRVSSTRLLETLAADRCIIIRLGQDKANNYEYRTEGTVSSNDSKTAKLNFLILRRILANSGLVVIDEALEDPTLIECRPMLDHFRIYALMAYPLVYRSGQIGFILIHRCSRSSYWSEFEKRMFATVAGHVGVAIANAQQFAAVQAMAVTDNLTGLYTQRLLEERFPVEVRNAQQQGYPLCLAMLDIDHFKHINDTCGHAAGDKVLRKFGFLLKTNLRKGTVAARYRGEGFVVILPNADLAVACQVMDKIRELVEKTITTDSGNSNTVSIGVSEAYFGDQLELQRVQEKLIQKAEENLCYAKRLGRNRVSTQFASEGKADKC